MKKKTIMVIAIIFALVVVLLVIGAILRFGGKAKMVQTDIVSRRTIESNVIAFGRVEPKSDVNISAEISEKIETIFVNEGDTVKVGDMLVMLNQDRYISAVNRSKAQVHQVEANLNKAMENLGKTKKLHSSGAVSDDALLAAQTEVDVLKAQLQSARAALEEAEDNLAQTIIKSPLDGIVTSLNAEKGEFVIVGTMNNPGSIIMTIAQLEDMQAEVEIDEADIVDIVTGQPVKIELDAIPDTFFSGTVVQVAHQATVQSIGGEETRANFKVKTAIENPSPHIKPGMSVTATITTARHDSVLAIPLSAVVAYHDTASDKEGEAVFIIQNGVAHKKKIHTGISDDKFIEVLDGIEQGDEIISGPFKVLRELSEGDRVKPIGKGKLRKHRFPNEKQRKPKTAR